MKCIVTGGAGFIGSHLVERLLLLGHQVAVLDNLSTGRKENISSFKLKKLKLVKIDLSYNINRIFPYFNNIDWVFHLAALADIVPSIEHPDKYYQTNVNGTVNVLEAARIGG